MSKRATEFQRKAMSRMYRGQRDFQTPEHTVGLMRMLPVYVSGLQTSSSTARADTTITD